MKPRNILYVTRISKGGVAIVMDQIVRGIDKNLYKPVILFDTPQSSKIRKDITNSGVKTIDMIECRELQHPKENQSGIKNDRFLVSIKTHFNERFSEIFSEMKSTWRFFFRVAPKALLFLHIIHKNKIDLVHTHSDLRRGQPEILAAWLSGIPCITHRHGCSRYSNFDKFFDRFVHTNVYISKYIAQYHISIGESRLKGKIIHNGVDINKYNKKYDSFKVRREFHCTSDQILIGHIARIDWWKGHEVFIEALASVANKNNKVKGFIIGGLAELNYNRSKRYLKTLINNVKRLGLEEKIIFTGHRSDIPVVLSALDIVVHASSIPEPFGLTVIEGMAAGKPVVATRAGGVLDIIENGVNGYLVPCRDPEKLAETIVKILSEKDQAKRIGTNARKRVSEKFTLKQQISSLQQLYDTIFANKKTA